MAFKQVSGGKFTYVKYAECKSGQVLAEGRYLGTREGTFGIQHQVRADDGTIQVLNSSGQLNYVLENDVAKGDYIQVKYNGSEILTTGKMKGKTAHQFLVFVDDEYVTDGSLVSTVNTGDSTDDDEVEDTDDDEVEDDAPAPTPVAAAKVTEKTKDVLDRFRQQKAKKAS